MVKTKAIFKKNNNETAKVKQNKPQNNSGTNNGIKKQKKDQSAVVAKNIKAKESLIKSQNNKLSNAKEIKEKQLETKNKIKKLLKNIPTQEQENSESDDDQEMASDDEEEEVNNSEDEEEEINDSEDEEEMNTSDVAEEENDSEINVSNGKNEGKERLKKDAKRNNEDEGIIVPRSDEKNSDSNTISKVVYDEFYEHKLFIDNLPMDTTFSDLFKLFSDCGSITKVLLINHDSFEYGFKIPNSLKGTIMFKSIDAITKALQYNETEFKGRQIAVGTIKKSGVTRKLRDLNVPGNVRKLRFEPNVSIFMRNVRRGTYEEQIKQFFSSCGTVEDIHLKGNGQALVRFTATDAISPALALNDTPLNGSNVSIIKYKFFERQNRPEVPNFTPLANLKEFEDNLIKKIEDKIMWKLQNKK